MDFFDKYNSNTLAGSGNQSFFETGDKTRKVKCRTYYKVFCGGEYNYSFLFSNIIDSTFADGSHSRKNMLMDTWSIHSLKVGITNNCGEKTATEPKHLHTLTFNGKEEKAVSHGELLWSDPIILSPKSGEYLCLELEFSGERIPCHPESIIPSFVLFDGIWSPSRLHPFVSMVGCDRDVKGRIAFMGDSITQGIGTDINSYAHWNALVADIVGGDYSYWNLGLGYGRADDAASDGAWLYKAKQNDIIVVCYGVNDILQGFGEDEIKANLDKIVRILSEGEKKVIIQTIPPFDFMDEKLKIWNNVNSYIKNELSDKVEFVFDSAALLGKSEDEPNIARFGGHPNSEGCRIWGKALGERIQKYCQK